MRKLCWFSGAFTLSTFLAVCFLPEELHLSAGVICGILGLVFLAFRGNMRRRILAVGLGLTIGFLWTGCFGRMTRTSAHALIPQGTGSYTLVVKEFPRKTQYGASLIAAIELEGAPDPELCLYAGEEALELLPGDRISAPLKLSRSDLRRGESYDYYQSRGIYLIGNVQEDLTLLERPGLPPPWFWPQFAVNALKNSISSVFPQEFSGFFTALLTGDKAFLPDGLYAALRRTGVAHIVAVSGLHISFLSGLFSALVKRRNRFTILLQIILLFFFAAMTGNSPSSLRAAFMASALLIAPLLGREDDRLTTLFAALFLLLLACPYSITSISLQLSFASLLGIILITGELNERLRARLPEGNGPVGKLLRRGWVFIAGSLAVSLGAMVFTLPLVALHYQTVSLVSLLSNILILWAVSITFVLGLLAALAGLAMPWLGGMLARIAAWPAGWIIWVVRGIAKWPFASISLFSGYLIVWFLTTYGILLLWLFAKGKIRFWIPCSALTLMLCAVIFVHGYSALNSGLTITVLDVGQGSSTLIYSNGHAVLVDCGGNIDNAGDIAADHLQSLGLSHLDALILTHYDSDHTNGVSELMERLDVARVILPDVNSGSEARARILSLCDAHRCNVELLYEEDLELDCGNANLKVYIPMGNMTSNLTGLSVLCTVKDFDLLITGDMDIATERRLLKYKDLPDIELLVVGHHGSKNATSPELLLATRPEMAVISVGYNSYGHPANQTLARLAAAGCKLYRTDWMGSVTFTVP